MATRKKANGNEERIKVPAGYQEIVGTRAPVWNPKAKGEYIAGSVVEDKVVKTKKGKKQITSRLLTLKDTDGSVQAVWVSAAIEQVLGQEKTVKGWNLMIVFEGLRKIKGQGNPMKVFRVFRKGK